MKPLCGLLDQSRDPRSAVALRWDRAAGCDRATDWSEFRGAVAGLRERLVAEPDGPWVLLTDDAYAFAVGLFALWHSGRHAISPPNHQGEALGTLQTRAAGVLTDRPDWFPEGSSIHPLHAAAGDPSQLSPLRRDAIALELYTSGTTGSEKPVAKQIRHLEDEVVVLRETWDDWLGDVTFVSTVSHQHLYGLLFGVLWPLAASRPFHSHHFLHVSELLPRMRELNGCVLSSVPTLLKQLARHEQSSRLGDTCRGVFSSGGPLPRETSLELQRVAGLAPIEVLGSTETGGIAFRTQVAESELDLWTPFPGVSVTCDDRDGAARVSSPIVSVEGDGAFAIGDRVSLHADGRFELLGRADRIVKVGEKRLDLNRMQSQLRGHDWVDDVALTTVEREAATRVAAAVVPSERGWREIRSDGRHRFQRELRDSLARAWDPVLHPRYWRVLQALPENSQGKLTSAALGALFRDVHREASDSDRLHVLDQLRGSDFIEQSCLVPRDLSCFAAHFPGHPVVPGVLQLDWAMDLVSELRGGAPRVRMIGPLKFLTPLTPELRIRIQLRLQPDGAAEFAISGDDVEYTKGRFQLDSSEESQR